MRKVAIAHDRQRRHQRRLSSDAVAEVTKHDGPERPRHAADHDGAERSNRPGRRVKAGEEQGCPKTSADAVA